MLDPTMLGRLRAAGLVVETHIHLPGEWYAGTITPEGVGGGDVGPYESAEDALVNGVRWIMALLSTTQFERDEAATEARQLRLALEAVRTELRKEREAKNL